MTRSRALLIEVEVELEEVDHVQSMDKVLRLWMLRVEVVEEVDLAQSIDKAEMLFPLFPVNSTLAEHQERASLLASPSVRHLQKKVNQLINGPWIQF